MNTETKSTPLQEKIEHIVTNGVGFHNTNDGLFRHIQNSRNYISQKTAERLEKKDKELENAEKEIMREFENYDIFGCASSKRRINRLFEQYPVLHKLDYDWIKKELVIN